jgi:hypothetical protein
MEVLQRYPDSLLSQLAEVAAGSADPNDPILKVNMDACGDWPWPSMCTAQAASSAGRYRPCF